MSPTVPAEPIVTRWNTWSATMLASHLHKLFCFVVSLFCFEQENETDTVVLKEFSVLQVADIHENFTFVVNDSASDLSNSL